MLQHLRIRNLALVEELTVAFDPGFSVLTGETGAGKSIIIGALALLMGDRADRTLIRAGADQASAEAVFVLADPGPVDRLLADLGLAPTDQGHLLIRRTLSTAGTGRQFVNDDAVTQAALKRLGDLLVDLHGPHDHQSLLSPDSQLRLLDAFGNLAETQAPYARCYREHQELTAQRLALSGDDRTFARELDFLAFEVRELEEAQPDPAEEASLGAEQAAAAQAQEMLETASGLLEALADGEASALQTLAAVQQQLDRLSVHVPEAAAWRDEARAAAVQVKELAAAIAARAQSIDADPERLHTLEARMALYHRLKRKYDTDAAGLQARLETGRARLRELQTRDARRAELAVREAAAAATLRETGLRLRARRTQAAAQLATAITERLRGLGFARAGFDVALSDTAPGPSGMDAVEFGFAPNPGEPNRPLRRIASSGEISRVMLAVKSVLADHDRIPVLVFDEIDANIGGETATAVGARLADLARTHQVIAITHMPQVAAWGRAHYAVRKRVAGNRTRTAIDRLAESARPEELARMLGGRSVTSVVLQHAQELLQKAGAARR